MPENNQSWSVCVLCYNEEGAISTVLEKLHHFLSEELSAGYEIIVINDGSKDNSLNEIERFQKKTPNSEIRIISHKTNLGIGMAIRTGYNAARNENVMAMCGDGQFQLSDLKKVLTFEKNEFISFYRRKKETYTVFRYFLSNTNRFINKYIFGINLIDVNWVKAYKRDQLKTIDFEITSSLVETEIASKLIKKGLKVKQVETEYLPRIAGEPKGASFRIVTLALLELFKLIFVLSTKKT
jgi:glycosyltransferase involved in cell wall biosynthesis